jgi:hypothetical protein
MLTETHRPEARGWAKALGDAPAPLPSLVTATFPSCPHDDPSGAVEKKASLLSVPDRFSDLQRTRTKEMLSGLASIATSPLVAASAAGLGWACFVGGSNLADWGIASGGHNMLLGMSGFAVLFTTSIATVVSGGVASVLSLVRGIKRLNGALGIYQTRTTSQVLEDFGVDLPSQDVQTSWGNLVNAFESKQSLRSQDQIALVIAGTDLAARLTNPNDQLIAYSTLARNLSNIGGKCKVASLIYTELVRLLTEIESSSQVKPEPHSVEVFRGLLNEVTRQQIPNMDDFAAAVVEFSKSELLEPELAIEMLIKVRSLVDPETVVQKLVHPKFSSKTQINSAAYSARLSC